MAFNSHELAALLATISFAAGINVYATVATLGLLDRFGVLSLPPSLQLLANGVVIGICIVLFVAEFFADKIPVLDLVWSALHTFVRIPIAALLAYQATATLPAWEQLAATLAGGLIALASHGGKIAARAAVTPSPEPVSNSVLSLAEDAFVVFLTWFATRHPYWAAGIVALLLIVIVLLIHWVIRAIRMLFSDVEHQLTGSESQ